MIADELPHRQLNANEFEASDWLQYHLYKKNSTYLYINTMSLILLSEVIAMCLTNKIILYGF